MTRPNGVNTNYSYDSLSRLLSVLHQAGASTIDGASYTVDATGNRTSKTDYLAGVTSNYTYDVLYELKQVTQATNTTENYTYDPVGNRLSSLTAATMSYNSANELTATPTVSYAYDNNGNTLTKLDSTGTTTYAWDFENRLSSVTLPGTGGSVSFKYDPFGRRIYKSSSTGTSVFAYDGINLVEETDSTGSVVARYAQIQSIDEPLAMLRSSTTSYFEQDGVSSVTSLSSAASALIQTYTFDSFGKQTASSGSLTNPFQYTAREFDSETGLYLLRSRYYDTSAGRFLSEDPIQFVTGAPYSYASNNPLIFADPFGLAPGDWWDPRTPGNFWAQWNPFNPNSGLSNTANSIGDSLSGMLTGDWKKVANSYDKGPLGTTAKCKCGWHTAEKGAVGGAGVAATAAGALIILDAAGVSSVGETRIGWKGGEITFTRPGCSKPDFRINPFGDDDWPPHYHRRPGIGKHRPWEGW